MAPDPVLLTGGPSAAELLAQIIMGGTTPAPVPGTNVFIDFVPTNQSNQGFVYQVLTAPGSGDPEFTMGTIVALERTRVDVIIYGNAQDLNGPRMETMRIRYLIASKPGYTYQGLRMLWAMPLGNVEFLGRDPNERNQFMASFEVTTDPGFV